MTDDSRREQSERRHVPMRRGRVLGVADVKSALSGDEPVRCVVVPRSDLNVVGFSASVPRGAFRGPTLPGAATARPD